MAHTPLPDVDKTMQDMQKNEQALASQLQVLMGLQKQVLTLLQRSTHDAEARKQLMLLNQAMKGDLGKMVKRVFDCRAQLQGHVNEMKQTAKQLHQLKYQATTSSTVTQVKKATKKSGRLSRSFA